MSDKVQLPANVHVSNHPCLQAKLSQLRSKDATPREVKALVHEISLILGCNALGQALTVAPGPAVRGYPTRPTSSPPQSEQHH